MATATKAHKYKGIWIEPCEYAGSYPGSNYHRGQWAIRTNRPGGTPWADDHCRHAYTLAQAKEIVDDLVLNYELDREYSDAVRLSQWF